MDAKWLMRALVDMVAAATQSEVCWPWPAAQPATEKVSDDELQRAQKIALAGWG